jgi:hypothetical protein
MPVRHAIGCSSAQVACWIPSSYRDAEVDHLQKRRCLEDRTPLFYAQATHIPRAKGYAGLPFSNSACRRMCFWYTVFIPD